MKLFLSFFSRKQTSISSAATVLIVMVFASRMLGLLRDRLLVSFFAPGDLGVYFAAFRLPNLLFELLVMGALTTAFIPVFTRYLAKGGENDAWSMASAMINIALVVLAIISIPLLIWTETVSRIFAPGFSDTQISTMALFTRLMILFQVFPLMIGNFLTGILQSYSLFLIPALAPVVYNIGIIGGVLLFFPTYGLMSPVIGVIVGAFLFMAIQIPLLISVGYKHSANFNPKTKGVSEVMKLMLPRTFGLAASQIDTTIDLMLASLLGARMVTIFNFAQHLQHLPVGLFGATVAQAALPQLSTSSVKKDKSEFKASIISAMHQILFFVLPASAFFIVLRIPIIRLVFGSTLFDWEATVLTSITLSSFSVSLFGQSLVHLLVRAFYALYDSRTPVGISVLSILANSAMSVYFILWLQLPVWSLGLSTSVASMFNALLLLVLLDKRVGGFSKTKLFVPIIKMGIATACAGVALYVPLKLLDQLVFDTTRTLNLAMLTIIVGGVGMIVYLFISWVLGVGEVHSFINQLQAMKKKGQIMFEPAREVVDGGTQEQLSR